MKNSLSFCPRILCLTAFSVFEMCDCRFAIKLKRHKILYNKGKERMKNSQNTEQETSRDRETPVNPAASRNTDLPDSPHDAERLKREETIIELPDVEDIPGQEFVHVAPLGELADITISSADEEGEGLFDDDADDDAFIPGTEAEVSK